MSVQSSLVMGPIHAYAHQDLKVKDLLSMDSLFSAGQI
jgi:hypothetical protein